MIKVFAQTIINIDLSKIFVFIILKSLAYIYNNVPKSELIQI